MLEIPVIPSKDLSPNALAPLLEPALTTTGFLCLDIKGHPLLDQSNRVFGISKRFFAEEKEEDKMQCRIGNDNRGYGKLGTETLDPEKDEVGDVKEFFNMGLFNQSNGKYTTKQSLPSVLSEGVNEIGRFQELCHDFCQSLLNALAVSLSLDTSFFSSQHTYSSASVSTLRLLYYPPSTASSSAHETKLSSRAGAHADYGSLTLLFQTPSGSNGLEILPPRSKEWTPVNVPPDCVLVNVGDALEFWTGGKFKSTLHRVTAGPNGGDGAGAERWSIAFFDQPDKEVPLVVGDGTVGVNEIDEAEKKRLEAKGVKLGERITAGEHLERRLNATYGELRKGGGKVEIMT
ncbi:Clavaminate synthase-like protein [Atractiella rhizophila]|nr:Clavaminate synthase-like protein [Atractiella rhizophila]